LKRSPTINSIAILLSLIASSCKIESSGTAKLSVLLKDNILVAIPVEFKVTEDFSNGFTLLNNEEAIPFQLDSSSATANFIHHPGNAARYTLVANDIVIKMSPHVVAAKKDGTLQLVSGSTPLVSYRYGMTYPPKGIDSVYRKSGYIHPIITAKGDTLTRIQPPDHYHHYGLWAPWTHTRIDTTLVDFWNLGQSSGTVLFKEFKTIKSGHVFSSFTAAQEHIDLKTPKAPRVAINEDLEVTLWDLGRDDRYMLDYESAFNSPLKNGILFEAYRYGGGLGLRFTERWKADNSFVLSSEGKDRRTADGSNARWCIVGGASSDGKGSNGILFLSHPENRMHPEPMRIWPRDSNNGRGDMFFEFCPIRHKEWKIAPNQDYSLNYRMVVFDGELTVEEAEAYWQAYAHPPEVKIISNQ
jgi:hypothetical protein